MNSAQYQRFAEAYAPAVLQAVIERHCYLPDGETAEVYALAASLAMLQQLGLHGVKSIAHYDLNTRGGAFRRTCATLGIECNPQSIERFLDRG